MGDGGGGGGGGGGGSGGGKLRGSFESFDVIYFFFAWVSVV